MPGNYVKNKIIKNVQIYKPFPVSYGGSRQDNQEQFID